MTRKERERLAHRREILLAARGVFARSGFVGATMEEVALAAEFGKATIYCYFDGKDELYHAVIEDVLEELAHVIDDSVRAEGGCAMRIELLVRRTLEAALTAPENLCLVARELHAAAPRVPLTRAVSAALYPLESLIRDEQRAGRMRPEGDPGQLAVILLTMVLGAFLSIAHTGHAESDAQDASCPFTASPVSETLDNAVRSVTELFLHGTILQNAVDPAVRTRRQSHPS